MKKLVASMAGALFVFSLFSGIASVASAAPKKAKVNACCVKKQACCPKQKCCASHTKKKMG